MSKEIPFCGYLSASGQGEVWDHTDANKFKQFGWRCTTNETEFSHNTLIGNWNEQRYDTKKMAANKPIPSQVMKKVDLEGKFLIMICVRYDCLKIQGYE